MPTAGTVAGLLHSVFDTAAPTPGPVNIERLVWFTGTSPGSNPNANAIYYNQANSSVLLSPGQYALVGPRPTTAIGRTISDTLSPQVIQLSPSAAIFNTSGQNIYQTNSITPPLGIVCVASSLPTVAGWTATIAPNGIGVSITEPLSSPNYYQAPTAPDPVSTYSTPIDTPLDKKAGTPLGTDFTGGFITMKTGTFPATRGYKTALLQRLANPWAAYDATLNPYITVDWLPIDLTIFNGEQLQLAAPKKPDPDDTAFQSPPSPFPFGGRQRGPITSPQTPDLWNNSYPNPPTLTSVPRGSNSLVFDYNLPQTLGFLNTTFSSTSPTPPQFPWAPGSSTAQAGYTGPPNPATVGATFPWLPWNNRPFANSMELMLVPATSAEQLMRQNTASFNNGSLPYYAANQANFQSPFQQLLPFMLTSTGVAGSTVRVLLSPFRLRGAAPSPFVGTDTMLNPTTFSSTTLSNEPGYVSFFHPPFNKVSNYRDPGLVNVNTIPGDQIGINPSPVWLGLLNSPTTATVSVTPTWQQIVASRRGYGTVGGTGAPPLLQNSASPSYFANPFRSAGGAAFRLPGSIPNGSGKQEADVTLMRPSPQLLGGGNNNPPAFGATAVPLFSNFLNIAPAAPEPYPAPNRNPYFAYQPMTRVISQLTTRSNVFAIWVTVGYFEVSPWPLRVREGRSTTRSTPTAISSGRSRQRCGQCDAASGVLHLRPLDPRRLQPRQRPELRQRNSGQAVH